MRLPRPLNLAIASVLLANTGVSVASGSSARPQRVVALGQEAIVLAASLESVLVSADGPPCPTDRLRISWREPGPEYEVGAYIEPVGPAPTASSTRVNGIVLCEGSLYSYMGFEAVLVKGEWIVEATPGIAEEDGDALANLDRDPPDLELDALLDTPALGAPRPGVAPPAPSGPPGAVPAPAANGPAIDGYAPYEPQRTCDPVAKPGALGFRNLALAGYPGSRSLGIIRACSVGGTSEHKEGRAFDWGVNVNRPAEKAAGDALVAGLLATDEFGNKHAVARRMGVMYIIWNRQIWSAHRNAEGWRPYSGASSHTDHVHVSFSWAGARAQTSYWSGQPVPTGIGEQTPSPFAPSDGGGGKAPTTRAAPAPAPKRTHATTPATDTTSPADGGPTREYRHRKPQYQAPTSTTRPSTTTTTTTTRPTTTTTTRPKPSTTTTTRPKTTTTTQPRHKRRSATTTTTTRPTTTTTRPPSTTTTTTSAPTTTTSPPATTTTTAPAPTTTAPPPTTTSTP